MLVWAFFSPETASSSAASLRSACMGAGACPYLVTRDFLSRQVAAVGSALVDAPVLYRKPIVHGARLLRSRQKRRLRTSTEVGACGNRNNDNMCGTGGCSDASNSHRDDISAKKPSRGCSSDSPLELIVLGLSHHTAPVELRERLSVPEGEWNNASALFCSYDSISEAAVLSTCNRFEVYLSGPNRYACIRDGMRIFEQRAGSDIDLQTLRSSTFVLSGDDALWHLFNVAAGLDSIVLGEGQILAQVKKAYEHGVEAGSGRAGKVVSRMLNSAITAGKRVRTETGIAKGAVSISSAAAEFTSGVLSGELPDLVQGTETSGCGAVKSTDKSCVVGSAPPLTMDKARITILGAGKMSRLLLIHLESHGIRNVTIVNRSPERMKELQSEFPGLNIELRSMEELYDTVRESDIIYPSTAAPNYLIEPEALRAALATRTRPHKLQIVDISVPRNVHPECANVPGVALYNVDHLKLVVDRNSARRQEEIAKAEGILREEMDKYRQWQQSLNAVPTIAKLHERGEALRQEEVQKLANKFVDLSDHNMELVDRLSRGIVAKLLHGPVQHLRQQNDVDAARAAIAQVREAFQLHHNQQQQQHSHTQSGTGNVNASPVAAAVDAR